MATACRPHVPVEFQDKLKPVVARFDQAHASTDGGVVLIKALDDQVRVPEPLAGCLRDGRESHKGRHSLEDLLRQRVVGLACGYEDGQDAARLAHDPMHTLAVGRDPVTGAALASQPTLSRWEHAVGPRALSRRGRTWAAPVIPPHRHRLTSRARRITIDLDPTDASTHGQQELAFFTGHDDPGCDLPLVATRTFHAEAEHSLVAIVLRPGNSPAKRGATGLLRPLLRCLRHAFPKAALRVRVDGGCAGNEWLDFLEAERVEYVGGAGQQPAAGAACRAPAGRGLRPVAVQRPH